MSQRLFYVIRRNSTYFCKTFARGLSDDSVGVRLCAIYLLVFPLKYSAIAVQCMLQLHNEENMIYFSTVVTSWICGLIVQPWIQCSFPWLLSVPYLSLQACLVLQPVAFNFKLPQKSMPCSQELRPLISKGHKPN